MQEELLVVISPHQVLGHQGCVTPWLHAGDGAQGSLHARQAFDQLSYIPSPEMPFRIE